jgi:hypothetical protein
MQKICDSLAPEDVDRTFLQMAAAHSSAVAAGGQPGRLRLIFHHPADGSESDSDFRPQLVFDRVVTKKTPAEFRTRVIQEGVHPSLHIQYKNFDLKQYLK